MKIKRITENETKDYVKLNPDDFNKPKGYDMSNVVAYTLTPISEKEGWEKVTYYGLKTLKN